MKKKFAYMLLSASSNPDEHQARFETDTRITYFVTVRSFEEAFERIKQLQDEEGIQTIELCGGFGPEKAREIIELTGGKVAVGYAVYFPEQQEMMKNA